MESREDRTAAYELFRITSIELIPGGGDNGTGGRGEYKKRRKKDDKFFSIFSDEREKVREEQLSGKTLGYGRDGRTYSSGDPRKAYN